VWALLVTGRLRRAEHLTEAERAAQHSPAGQLNGEKGNADEAFQDPPSGEITHHHPRAVGMPAPQHPGTR
jgi:hypothetical protein